MEAIKIMINKSFDNIQFMVSKIFLGGLDLYCNNSYYSSVGRGGGGGGGGAPGAGLPS